jgi:hypothetical protein
VIASADPLISVLIDGRTARLLDRPGPERWSAAVTATIEDRQGSQALAASAREYVKQHFRASAHVAAVVDAYEWMTSRQSIPFAEAKPGNVR